MLTQSAASDHDDEEDDDIDDNDRRFLNSLSVSFPTKETNETKPKTDRESRFIRKKRVDSVS